MGCTSVPGHSSFIQHEESKVSTLKAFDFCDLLSVSHFGKYMPAFYGKTGDLSGHDWAEDSTEHPGLFDYKRH